MKEALDLTREVVVITDRNLTLSFANKAAKCTLGCTEGDFWPAIITPLLTGDSPPLFDPHKLIESSRNRSVLVELNTSSGKRSFIVRLDTTGSDPDGGFAILLEQADKRINDGETYPAERRIGDDLKNKVEQINLITDNIPAFVSYFDKNEKVVFVNRMYEQWLSKDRADIVGKSVREALGEEKYNDVKDHIDTALTGRKVSFGRAWTDPDGQEKRFHGTYVPHFDKRREVKGVFTLVSDITRQAQAEKELRKSHQLLNAISAAQSLYISDAKSSAVFDTLMSTLISLTDSEYGFIGEKLYEPDGSAYLKTVAVTGIKWEDGSGITIKDGEGVEFHKFDNLLGAVISEEKPVISNNPSDDPRSAGVPLGHPALVNFMGLPIIKGGVLLGMLGVANRVGGYSEELAAFLSPYLSTCANIFEATRIEMGRRDMEKDLRKNQDSLAKAQEVAHIGNWDWDLHLNEVTCSDEIYRIGKFDNGGEKDALDWFLSAVYFDDKVKVRKAIENTLKGDGGFDIEHRVIRPDGTVGIIQSQGEVFLDEAGIPARMVGVLNDITERKQLENDLRERTKRLQEINAFKNKMISVVSHDLRSPFTSNIGLLNLLLNSDNDPLSDRQRTFVETMGRSLQHQFSLVESLLELSKVYRGNIKIRKETVCVRELFEGCAGILGHLANEKGIRIVEESDDSHMVNVDGEKMTQVVNNLITNAIKFSNEGGAIRLVSEKNGDEISLLVIDNGTGIQADKLEKLFDLSTNSSSIGTKGEKGTGLGLSICRELTILNNGSISITSEPEEGTTVRMVFKSAQ